MMIINCGQQMLMIMGRVIGESCFRLFILIGMNVFLLSRNVLAISSHFLRQSMIKRQLLEQIQLTVSKTGEGLENFIKNCQWPFKNVPIPAMKIVPPEGVIDSLLGVI